MSSKLLLYTCCAPCLSGVFSQLNSYDVVSYYYNPNIADKNEHDSRLQELIRYADMENISIIHELFNRDDLISWTNLVGPYKDLGEKSYRCELCFQFRLEKTFKTAKKMGITTVASTLSVSPHKNAELINQIGNELAQKYSLNYLESNFKKNGGFALSVQNSKKYGFYRQNYCGCAYSKKESLMRTKN
ncbi:MAG TPA: epoxyqueuosine reductase QueH [Spirochaetota bacterium]|nr:epoxyqueuosine reductase QueH [Spirochaetota bacterium]